jgi:predicted amidohydrolase YtcJ
MLEATLVILNANVITLDRKQPRAKAIAVQNGMIIGVGSDEKIRHHVGKETKVIDARNKTVVPGLVDCHVHMTDFGFSLQNLDLRDVKSIKELQQKLCEYARENPRRAWILKGRWDQERLVEKRYPTCRDLDAAVPDRPVFLVRVCGHMAVANSKALQHAGITRNTTVEGGKIDIDKKSGEPSGIVRESALNLIHRAIPKPSLEQLEEACILACEKAVEAGLTGVHWLVGSADEVRVLQKLCSEGKLLLRVYLGMPVELMDDLVNLGLVTGFGNDMLKIGFVKVFADGSLGAHTAALKEPYSDRPETRGMMLHSQNKLDQIILKAHKTKLQLGVHAIGDRAVENVLKAFKKALKRTPRENHRHRIEHCSVLNPKLIASMKRLGIVASVQPHFVVSDFWTVDRVGKERLRWVYPLKTLIDKGLHVVSGSDCPVEKINPLLGVWAAVTRKDFSEESLTAEEALKTYTSDAAYASFDEERKGTIELGKFADLTILSDDLFGLQPDAIREVAIAMTVVDGKVVYSGKSSQKYRD